MTIPNQTGGDQPRHKPHEVTVENEIPPDAVVPNERGSAAFRESFGNLTLLQDWIFNNIETWDAESTPTVVFVETPTSSGKTLAVGGAIFETLRDRYGTGLFLYPFRALTHDQHNQLASIRNALELPEERLTTFLGGDPPETFIRAMDDRDHLLTTPDKLAYLLAASGDRGAISSATQLLTRSRFLMLDEVHTYTGMMLWHMIYLLKAWEHLSTADSDIDSPTVFVVTATLPEHVKSLFRNELEGDYQFVGTEPRHRVSLGGDWRVTIEPTRLTPTVAANRATSGTVAIFDTAWEALEAKEKAASSESLDSARTLLYIGQDKQPAEERVENIEILAEQPDVHTFFASRAAEAGVDYETNQLLTGVRAEHPITPASSLVQRVGRAGRAKSGGPLEKPPPAEIEIHSPELWQQFDDKSVDPMTREAFEDEIRCALPTTDPDLEREYYGFAAIPWWSLVERAPGASSLSDSLTRAHQKLLQSLDPDPADTDVFFRSFIPFARYQSGETISYRSLFRTTLSVTKDRYIRVTGRPDPHRFYDASVPHGIPYANRPAKAKTTVRPSDAGVRWKTAVEGPSTTYLLVHGTFKFKRQRTGWKDTTMVWFTRTRNPAPEVEFKLELDDRRHPAGFVDERFWTTITSESNP